MQKIIFRIAVSLFFFFGFSLVIVLFCVANANAYTINDVQDIPIEDWGYITPEQASGKDVCFPVLFYYNSIGQKSFKIAISGKYSSINYIGQSSSSAYFYDSISGNVLNSGYRMNFAQNLLNEGFLYILSWTENYDNLWTDISRFLYKSRYTMTMSKDNNLVPSLLIGNNFLSSNGTTVLFSTPNVDDVLFCFPYNSNYTIPLNFSYWVGKASASSGFPKNVIYQRTRFNEDSRFLVSLRNPTTNEVTYPFIPPPPLELPDCIANDDTNVFECPFADFERGINYRYGEDDDVNHINLAPDTKFYSHQVVNLKFNDKTEWLTQYIFTPDIPPCTADLDNRTILCEDFTDVFISLNSGVDWTQLEENRTFFPNDYIFVAYLDNRNDNSKVLKFKFSQDSQRPNFAEVNMDALRCSPYEDTLTCNIADWVASSIETLLNGVFDTISGLFDVFFPFDFNLSERVGYCADFWDIPHPTTLNVPSFSASGTNTGSGNINVGEWFDVQYCTIGGEVKFKDSFGGGDFAIYFLMMIAYYGLFFRNKKSYGETNEKIILPKLDV